MDRRDAMQASYYMQRGMQSDSASQFALHGSTGMQSITNPNAPFQSNIGSVNIGSALPVEHSSNLSSHGGDMGVPSAMSLSEPAKRKRGRPRKYGTDRTVSLGLSSSPASPAGTVGLGQKRGRGRPPGSGRKQQLASLGSWLSGSAGMGFTPHIITVAIGEDISTKIVAFSQQGPRAICIMSANGAVSTVTLRQPSSSGGTITYEGRFEIICLSGSYLVTDNGGARNRTGGLSVSLASPDGRVIGGGVGGMLIAASPVQVIVGSFIWGGSKTKNKKADGLEESDHQSADNAPSQNMTQAPSWPGSRTIDMHNAHGGIDLMSG